MMNRQQWHSAGLALDPCVSRFMYYIVAYYKVTFWVS